MKKANVVISIPSGHLWEAEFGMSLVLLSNYIVSHKFPEHDSSGFRIHNAKGSILAQLRERALRQALESGASHLLFIDSDQTFPRDTLHRLIAHKKQVVACNIATKSVPSNPTARLRGKGSLGTMCYTLPSSTGLEEVWRVGTGIMLIDLNIFKREGMRKPPYFAQRWNEATQDYVGEDWAFGDRLEAAGVRVYIDHDLSKEVGHVGPLVYDHDLVQPEEIQEAS